MILQSFLPFIFIDWFISVGSFSIVLRSEMFVSDSNNVSLLHDILL